MQRFTQQPGSCAGQQKGQGLVNHGATGFHHVRNTKSLASQKPPKPSAPGNRRPPTKSAIFYEMLRQFTIQEAGFTGRQTWCTILAGRLSPSGIAPIHGYAISLCISQTLATGNHPRKSGPQGRHQMARSSQLLSSGERSVCERARGVSDSGTGGCNGRLRTGTEGTAAGAESGEVR